MRILPSVVLSVIAAFVALSIGVSDSKVGRAEELKPFRDLILEADVRAYQLRQSEALRRLSTHPTRRSLLGRFKAAAVEEDWKGMIEALETLLGTGQANFILWLQLTEAWTNYSPEAPEGAVAAYGAYLAATDRASKAEALALVARALARSELWRRAALAFEASLDLAPGAQTVASSPDESGGIHSTFSLVGAVGEEEDYKQEKGWPRVKYLRNKPQLCFQFSMPLADPKLIDYSRFLKIVPEIVTPHIDVQSDVLCLGDAEYDRPYSIEISRDFTSRGGDRLAEAATLSFRTTDRPASLHFRNKTLVLPRLGAGNIPLHSVNVTAAKLRLLRINDRNLVNEIVVNAIGAPIDQRRSQEIAETFGELVKETRIVIREATNDEIVTLIPFTKLIVDDPEPGVYILMAQDTRGEFSETTKVATQWLVQTDIGVVSLAGAEELFTAARFLSTGKPIAGAKVSLLARNNAVLDTLITDEIGVATFKHSLGSAKGGRRPAAVVVETSTDFAFLDIRGGALDLADRGVGGREWPGPIDAFVYTDRGIYRPGERVQCVVLLRDAYGRALPPGAVMPRLRLLRPDKIVVKEHLPENRGANSYHWDVELPETLRQGTWSINVYADPSRPPVGSVSFQVEDFVPQRVALTIDRGDEVLRPDRAASIEVMAKYLYGAPATGLRGEASVTLQPATQPWPEWAGYHFGPPPEEFEPISERLEIVRTDAEGRTVLHIGRQEMPITKLPLEALVDITLFEVSGRPIRGSVVLQVRRDEFSIGVRPLFAEGVPANRVAKFDVVALDPQGREVKRGELSYTLSREHDDSYAYIAASGNQFYKALVRTEEVVEQRLFLSASGPTRIAARVESGRYRLDILHNESGAVTTLRFAAGWWVSPEHQGPPDKVKVKVDCPRTGCRPGDIATVKIDGTPASEAFITVVNDRVHLVENVSLPEGGGSVQFRVGQKWEPGGYVLVTVFGTGAQDSRPHPRRSVGVDYFAIDRSRRELAVSVELEEPIRPRERLTIPVVIRGIPPGESAWLSLAAVDQGILQLTSFAAPAPVTHFFGQRALGVDVRDLYGKLISDEDGTEARFGGDADHRRGLPVDVVQTVALSSGIVAVDASGRANITLEMPDYNGELRLMVVAWSESAVGALAQPLLVRDPIVAELALPRFMAPGDEALATLSVYNPTGPRGSYKLEVSAEGPLEFLDARPIAVTLDQGEQTHLPLQLLSKEIAGANVTGEILLTVTGPGRLSFRRTWPITVRIPRTYSTKNVSIDGKVLEAGDSLSLDPSLSEEFFDGTVDVLGSFSTLPTVNLAQLVADAGADPSSNMLEAISKGLLLVHFDRNGKRRTAAEHRNKPDPYIQELIDRIASTQTNTGGVPKWPYVQRTFGDLTNKDSWDRENEELEITGLALDFMLRAREFGYHVPSTLWNSAIQYLGRSTRETSVCDTARTTSLNVLARAGASIRDDLLPYSRLYIEECKGYEQFPLGVAEIGVALYTHGNLAEADGLFLQHLKEMEEFSRSATLRDAAAMLTLWQIAGRSGDEVVKLAGHVTKVFDVSEALSSLDRAYLGLAFGTLQKTSAKDIPTENIVISINGERQPVSKDFHFRERWDENTDAFRVRNLGNSAVHYRIGLRGIPKGGPLIEEGKFSIKRRFFGLSGKELFPKDGAFGDAEDNKLHQGDIVAVVLDVGVTEERDLTVVDLLPAGFEVEDPFFNRHSRSAPDLRRTVSPSAPVDIEYIEIRKDRYIATINTNPYYEGDVFTLVYLARAVTPGHFILPSAYAEDRIDRSFSAQTPEGEIVILPRER